MKNMQNFDESLVNYNSLNGYVDQEYREFEEKVISGQILEKDCNPQWLSIYQKIRKNHSKQLIRETSDYRDLKDGEYKDRNPDDFDDND